MMIGLSACARSPWSTVSNGPIWPGRCLRYDKATTIYDRSCGKRSASSESGRRRQAVVSRHPGWPRAFPGTDDRVPARARSRPTGRGFTPARPADIGRSSVSGRIAQLVEQLTLNQRVPGSSPGAPTNKINWLWGTSGRIRPNRNFCGPNERYFGRSMCAGRRARACGPDQRSSPSQLCVGPAPGRQSRDRRLRLVLRPDCPDWGRRVMRNRASRRGRSPTTRPAAPA